jgi:hypothetical protein
MQCVLPGMQQVGYADAGDEAAGGDGAAAAAAGGGGGNGRSKRLKRGVGYTEA